MAQRNWPGRAWTSSRRVFTWIMAQVRRRYGQLKTRYGIGYTRAMLVMTLVTFFSPIPMSTFVGIAFIVMVAEVHRAISRSGVFRQAIATEERFMSIQCDVIVNRKATPEELTGLGIALWSWCHRTTRSAGIYQHLDNQVLADLIAGRLPGPGQTPEQSRQAPDGIHFTIRDDESNDSEKTIAGLRRAISARALIDIVVAGVSWSQDLPGRVPATIT